MCVFWKKHLSEGIWMKSYIGGECFCRKLEHKYNFEKILKSLGREEDCHPFYRLLNLHPKADINLCLQEVNFNG